MSSESINVGNGFFARIIRDALCSLPEVSGGREPLALEQQLQVVVEHSESAALATPPSNSHTQSATQTVDTIAPAIVPHSVALQHSPSPVSSARNIVNAKTTSSPGADQHPVAAAVSETSTLQAADKTAANFPRTNRMLVAQQPVKKIPLAITMRDARTSKDRRLAPTVQRTESAQTVVATAPAVESFPKRLTDNLELTSAETARVEFTRQGLQDAQPVIAESAPLIAAHHMVERKTPPPALRIGAVTIRVVDATPEPAVSSRASKPVAHSIAVDPIASAESRHFLRTL